MNKSQLNLAAICRKTSALGPGSRAVIWIQGCPFRCQGCISPEWIPFIQAEQYDPQALIESLLSDPDISGVSISGGEPITQASALVKLIQHGKSIRDINIILYTGYYYENLLAFPTNSPVQQLLSLVDVLIDGPYIESENDDRGLRGSSNQRVIHLTQKLKHYDFEHSRRQSDIQISNGEVLFVGVPPVGVLTNLLTSLETCLDTQVPGG